MNTTRIGKIARLPHAIREKLNLKLHDGIPAKFILPWLNSLPETKAIIAADFDNYPVSKQNLSEWKQGGFRDWLLQFQAAQFLIDSSSSSFSSSSSISISPESHPNILPLPRGEGRGEGEETVHQSATPAESKNSPVQVTHHASRITDLNHASRITSKLLLWTQLQYIAMARHIDSESDPDRKFTALRHFANDISRLKRSSLADDYLQIQRDWLSLSQSNTAEKKEKQFWDWTKRPDIEKKLFPDRSRGMTAEELYQFEKDCCLMGDGPGPEVAELMAEVRIAKKLLELRKAQEAEAKAKAHPNYDPHRPLPDTRVKLAGMPFEELFPTIPDKPLTQTHPELDDLDPADRPKPEDAPASGQSVPSASSPHPSDQYDSVKLSQTQSNHPPSPFASAPDSHCHPASDNSPGDSPINDP